MQLAKVLGAERTFSKPIAKSEFLEAVRDLFPKTNQDHRQKFPRQPDSRQRP